MSSIPISYQTTTTIDDDFIYPSNVFYSNFLSNHNESLERREKIPNVFYSNFLSNHNLEEFLFCVK